MAEVGLGYLIKINGHGHLIVTKAVHKNLPGSGGGQGFCWVQWVVGASGYGFVGVIRVGMVGSGWSWPSGGVSHGWWGIVWITGCGGCGEWLLGSGVLGWLLV